MHISSTKAGLNEVLNYFNKEIQYRENKRNNLDILTNGLERVILLSAQNVAGYYDGPHLMVNYSWFSLVAIEPFGVPGSNTYLTLLYCP